VNMILAEPVKRVIAQEPAHLIATRAVEVHSRAPRCCMPPCEIRTEPFQVVARGAKMVVNHVQNDSQTMLMTGIHETLEAVRSPITMVRSIQIDAVVAPAPCPRKFRHWHQLDVCNAEIHEVPESFDG